MTRTELLDWMLEKNGLAETIDELAIGEQPTEAMVKVMNDIWDAQCDAEAASIEAYHKAQEAVE
jgi:cytochrome c553